VISSPIVVGIDGSPVGGAALLWAARAAQAWQRPLQVVLAGDIADASDLAAGSPDPSRELLDAAVNAVRHAGIVCDIQIVLHDEQPEPLLTRLSADASLLVVGARPEGRLSSLLFGSVSGHLQAHGRCPVVTVPPEWIGHDVSAKPSVVVGVKPSPGGRAALDLALSYAQANGASLIALRCWDRSAFADDGDPLAERDLQRHVLDTTVDAAAARYPFLRVHRQLTPGPVEDALRFAALSADLLVVGTRYETGSHGSRLGPVAGRLSRRMPCPVAVVSAPPSDVQDAAPTTSSNHSVGV